MIVRTPKLYKGERGGITYKSALGLEGGGGKIRAFGSEGIAKKYIPESKRLRAQRDSLDEHS